MTLRLARDTKSTQQARVGAAAGSSRIELLFSPKRLWAMRPKEQFSSAHGRQTTSSGHGVESGLGCPETSLVRVTNIYICFGRLPPFHLGREIDAVRTLGSEPLACRLPRCSCCADTKGFVQAAREIEVGPDRQSNEAESRLPSSFLRPGWSSKPFIFGAESRGDHEEGNAEGLSVIPDLPPAGRRLSSAPPGACRPMSANGTKRTKTDAVPDVRF